MPLRVRKGVAIKPPRRRKPPALPTAAALMGATVGAKMLPVRLIPQETNQWCWAACTQMVAEFLGKANVKQCELANFLHRQTKCCQNPLSSKCNLPSPFAGISKVYNHVRIECVSEALPSSVQTVLRELAAGRPLEMGLLWNGGGGHVALIIGVTQQGLFAVNDPWFGAGLYTYLALRAAYGQGRWGFSFGVFRNA